MNVLGIDTSCDDTSLAIVNDQKTILAHCITTQDHSRFGGVLPEFATKGHLENIAPLYHEVMAKSALDLNDIECIAITTGPGLVGSLIIGMMFAKGIASSSRIPLIEINHLEAHLLSIRLTESVSFPFLALLVSGGHCQIVLVRSPKEYLIIGETLDDSLGETLDKVARALGFGYPGGPIIETNALLGNEKSFSFPMPLCKDQSCNFSFSGLKSAVRLAIKEMSPLPTQGVYDICASLQKCVTDILILKTRLAIKKLRQEYKIYVDTVALVGGVASNQYIVNALKANCSDLGIRCLSPPPHLCTDNGAMIAWNAIEIAAAPITLKSYDHNRALASTPKPRWSPGYHYTDQC